MKYSKPQVYTYRMAAVGGKPAAEVQTVKVLQGRIRGRENKCKSFMSPPLFNFPENRKFLKIYLFLIIWI